MFESNGKSNLNYKLVVFMLAFLILVLTNKPTIAAMRDYNHVVPMNSQGKPKATIAIVIDDFGNKMGGTDQMLKLPVPITVAVMPFLKTTAQDAEKAHQMGHDVIVHMPMEPRSGRASWLGPGAILSNMPDAEIERRVREAIAAVPHAVGMNNHMGSKVTADKRVMRAVLKVCKEKGLFFLDSRTNYRSVIGQVGQELGVPVINNHLFFDDVFTDSHVSKQWGKLLKLSETQPVSVAIGHVGAGGVNTAAVLHRSIPPVIQGYHFVRISELVKKQQ